MLSSAYVNLRVTISSRDATVHNTEGGGVEVLVEAMLEEVR